VAEVGWTRRASSAPGVRKVSWHEEALAWRKLEAPPDAGHGWREGETVRGNARFFTDLRKAGPRVKALGFTTRRKAFSGCCAFGPHRSGVAESFGSQVKPRFVLRKGRVASSGSGGSGDRLGRACG